MSRAFIRIPSKKKYYFFLDNSAFCINSLKIENHLYMYFGRLDIDSLEFIQLNDRTVESKEL